jgi:hypothetical protein
MSLYVFLRTGRRSSLSDVVWPAPSDDGPGAWVEAGTGATPGPIRAFPAEELPWSLDDELWEVELGGDAHPEGRGVVAERGRLLRPVEACSSCSLSSPT